MWRHHELSVETGAARPDPDRKIRRIAVALLAATTFLPFGPVAGGEGSPRVSGIQAKLFYERTGTFSPDVLHNPGFWLWNAPIGEGSAKGHSNATVVLVEVAREPGEVDSGQQLEFSAAYRVPVIDAGGRPELRDLRLEKTVGLCGAGPDGKCLLGFWLHDTGCTHVTLRAVISGQPAEASLEETILFECGE